MRIHACHGFLPRLSYLPRPVRLPAPPLPRDQRKHLTFKRTFLSFSPPFPFPQHNTTARIKRHSSTYPHSISSDISLPSLPPASQVHPKNINSPSRSAAPSALLMRAYDSTTSAGGATPLKYLEPRQAPAAAAAAAQNAAGLPRGRLD
jgi:hypothetical protein